MQRAVRCIQNSKSKERDGRMAARKSEWNQRVRGSENKSLDIAESYTNPDLARVCVIRELRWEKRLTVKTWNDPPNETRVGWGTPGFLAAKQPSSILAMKPGPPAPKIVTGVKVCYQQLRDEQWFSKRPGPGTDRTTRPTRNLALLTSDCRDWPPWPLGPGRTTSPRVHRG